MYLVINKESFIELSPFIFHIHINLIRSDEAEEEAEEVLYHHHHAGKEGRECDHMTSKHKYFDSTKKVPSPWRIIT